MIDELELLKRLLWKEWDPIGVNDIDGAAGEYDSYASQIFVMLMRGDTEQEIRNYLNFVETECIGLSPSGKNPRIVERIFEIDRSAK